MALFSAFADAQEASLQLRSVDRLSTPASVPQESKAPPDGGLELRLERQLAPAKPAARPPADISQITELLVETDLNRQRLNDTVVVLRTRDGSFFVSGEDLDRWRVRHPESGLEYRGQLYFALANLPGVTYELDEARQTLDIQTGAEAFTQTVTALPVNRITGAPVLPQPGGFFNYDLSATKSSGLTRTGGLFEAGFFSRYGVLTTTAAAPDLGDSTTWNRLETTYTIDNPAKIATTRLGDSITTPGVWGRAVRFGGFQYGRNFNTQPGFVRFPTLAAAGEATLPSTVDVFVNNALVARRSVPPGPFSITNVPVVSGAGNLQVVVRDVLGREQFISTPFYGSTTLLKAGVSDYSIEAGVARQDFGLASTHYAGGLGSGTYRSGLTDTLTAEARGELDGTTRAIGGSGATKVGTLGVLNATTALSSSDPGYGGLLGYGFEHNSRPVSVSFQNLITSNDFRQAGMQPKELPRRRQTFGTIGVQMGPLGSLSLTHAAQVFRDAPALQVLTAAYSLPVAKLGQISLTGVKTYGESGGLSLFLAFTMPIDLLTSGTLAVERRTDNSSGVTTSTPSAIVQRSLPIGEGYGYRAQLRDQDFLGEFDLQGAHGRYSVEVGAPHEGDPSYRLGAAGGIGTMGGYYFFSRTISDSFAVVHVADYPNVRVMQDNQIVGRTDAHGYAVLPRMRAYELNPLGVEQSDLPMDAKISGLKLEATPYFRSGVFVEFPIARVRAATLHIILYDGSDLPSGAVARIVGKPEQFPVALRGEAYLEGFEEVNRIQFSWKGQQCTIEVVYPKTSDPLPNLGTHLCKGVEP